MQETVTTNNERKSLFSSFLEVLEAREKQAQADRQLQEEKYLRRTQRIYDYHGEFHKPKHSTVTFGKYYYSYLF